MTIYKTIRNIVLFLFLLIGADRLTGLYMDTLYKKNTCYYSNGELNAFQNGRKYDTLFVGSSRVLHMINPSYLGPNSFNLAKQQKHLYHNIALIDLLHQSNKLPRKLLVLNIDPQDCYNSTEKSLVDDVYSLKYYYHSNELVKKLINRRGFQEQFKFLSSLYRHNEDGWKLIINPMEGICTQYPLNGYIPLYSTKNDEDRLKKSLNDTVINLDSNDINPLALDLIKHLKEICHKEKIDLKIINAPYYNYPKALFMTSKFLDDFCEENNIAYHDFNIKPIDSLHRAALWFDNMHTNDKGATIYSIYLKKILNTINN